jgi:hypothetical protein
MARAGALNGDLMMRDELIKQNTSQHNQPPTSLYLVATFLTGHLL